MGHVTFRGIALIKFVYDLINIHIRLSKQAAVEVVWQKTSL